MTTTRRSEQWKVRLAEWSAKAILGERIPASVEEFVGQEIDRAWKEGYAFRKKGDAHAVRVAAAQARAELIEDLAATIQEMNAGIPHECTLHDPHAVGVPCILALLRSKLPKE